MIKTCISNKTGIFAFETNVINSVKPLVAATKITKIIRDVGGVDTDVTKDYIQDDTMDLPTTFKAIFEMPVKSITLSTGQMECEVYVTPKYVAPVNE